MKNLLSMLLEKGHRLFWFPAVILRIVIISMRLPGHKGVSRNCGTNSNDWVYVRNGLQLEWISAAEGQKFARVMKELDAMRAEVTKKEVEETIQILNRELAREQEKRTRKPAPAERVAIL